MESQKNLLKSITVWLSVSVSIVYAAKYLTPDLNTLRMCHISYLITLLEFIKECNAII